MKKRVHAYAMNAIKVVLSAFIVLNLFTVLFMNMPVSWARYANAIINTYANSATIYRLQYASWLVQRYAHLVGLDNRWQMFGRQSRFNWWYLIKAQYDDGKQVILPLVIQAPRTIGQNVLFDFKDAKFYLNIYNHQRHRQAYAYYLCREFPHHGNAAIQSIRYERHWQQMRQPAEAATLGTHLMPKRHYHVLQVVPCSSAQPQGAAL